MIGMMRTETSHGFFEHEQSKRLHPHEAVFVMTNPEGVRFRQHYLGPRRGYCLHRLGQQGRHPDCEMPCTTGKAGWLDEYNK